MALNFRFCCIVPSRRFVKNYGTGNALTSYLVCKTMSCDENSFKHNKQTSSSGERKRFISCIKVRFSSPESMMEDFPFFSGWGWDFLLSLGKEFEVAARVILRWISFELWNSLDCTMPSCGMCLKRRPKNEDRRPKTLWSKTKTHWSKTKTHWSKTKTLWSKTKTHWSKPKTHWSKTKTHWSKTKTHCCRCPDWDKVTVTFVARTDDIKLIYALQKSSLCTRWIKFASHAQLTFALLSDKASMAKRWSHLIVMFSYEK